MWEKDKTLVNNIFAFSHSVFKNIFLRVIKYSIVQ